MKNYSKEKQIYVWRIRILWNMLTSNNHTSHLMVPLYLITQCLEEVGVHQCPSTRCIMVLKCPSTGCLVVHMVPPWSPFLDAMCQWAGELGQMWGRFVVPQWYRMDLWCCPFLEPQPVSCGALVPEHKVSCGTLVAKYILSCSILVPWHKVSCGALVPEHKVSCGVLVPVHNVSCGALVPEYKLSCGVLVPYNKVSCGTLCLSPNYIVVL